ncbi:MAG: hypothetical protein ACYDAG_13700, partial [Chloroflexota bacterium]
GMHILVTGRSVGPCAPPRSLYVSPHVPWRGHHRGMKTNAIVLPAPGALTLPSPAAAGEGFTAAFKAGCSCPPVCLGQALVPGLVGF